MRWMLMVAIVALLAGCGADAQERLAAQAAMEFAQSPPERACMLLAPDTHESVSAGGDCATRLAEIDLPRSTEVSGTTVAGLSAQVRLDSQVVFLAQFDDGWLVTAAGCTRDDPDPAVPYDCEVEP